MIDPRLIDDRRLAFGRSLASRLIADPLLIVRARETASRWLTLCPPSRQPELREWLTVLDGPIDAVIALLTQSDERSVRLRRSNPFAGVLDTQERNAIIRQFHRASLP